MKFRYCSMNWRHLYQPNDMGSNYILDKFGSARDANIKIYLNHRRRLLGYRLRNFRRSQTSRLNCSVLGQPATGITGHSVQEDTEGDAIVEFELTEEKKGKTNCMNSPLIPLKWFPHRYKLQNQRMIQLTGLGEIGLELTLSRTLHKYWWQLVRH